MSMLLATFRERHTPRKPPAPKARPLASCRSIPTVSVAVWHIGGPKFHLDNSWTGNFWWILEPCGQGSLVTGIQSFLRTLLSGLRQRAAQPGGARSGGGNCHLPSAGTQTCHQPVFPLPPRRQGQGRLHYLVLSWSVGENGMKSIESLYSLIRLDWSWHLWDTAFTKNNNNNKER